MNEPLVWVFGESTLKHLVQNSGCAIVVLPPWPKTLLYLATINPGPGLRQAMGRAPGWSLRPYLVSQSFAKRMFLLRRALPLY
jgi:hypothetical protein